MANCRSLILALVLVTACGSPGGQPPVTPDELSHAQITPRQLTDEQFDRELHGLLLHGPATVRRLNSLVAVVRTQLERAAELFSDGYEPEGLATVEGALDLVRVGELRPEMFRGVENSLLLAAAHVARHGDEGRARALYSILARKLDKGDPRAEQVTSHLRSLQQWQSSTQDPETAEGAEASRLASAKRVLMEPTPKTLEKARKDAQNSVLRALKVDSQLERPSNHEEQDEYFAAQRIIGSSATTLAALYLRDGDAGGAVVALSEEPIALVTRSELVERLSQAADGNVDAWAELFGFYASSATETHHLDFDIARSAAWGAALELYRAEPTELRSAIPLANLLVEQGMATVAPLVLKDSVEGNPEPRALSWALRLVLRALVRSESAGQLTVARRVYRNAEPLVRLASTAKLAGRVRPSAADLMSYVGGMESRAGQLDSARVYLKQAVQVGPTRNVLRLLAAIERQRGNSAGALNSARSMRALADSEGDVSGQARARLLEYEILRDIGQTQPAAEALAAALRLALRARASVHTGGELAFAEATLAEILERYGKLEAANRAASRAQDAASNNLEQLAMTLQDAARRAYTAGDVTAGRLTLRRAIDARLEDDTLVYIALWTRLLERQAGTAADGSVDEALSLIEPSDSWVGTLREWGRGKLSDEGLMARARTTVERIEADFYVTASRHAREASPQTLHELSRLAQSEAIELVEVRIARDIVASGQGQTPPPLPDGIQLP